MDVITLLNNFTTTIDPSFDSNYTYNGSTVNPFMANTEIPAPLYTTPKGPEHQEGPNISNQALYISIIVVCSTIMFLAICCGGICLCKLKYRFVALRLNFINARFRNTESGGRPAMSNDYLSSPTSRKVSAVTDSWELSPENLVIHKTHRLGNGAFAIVYKGVLTGRNPLLLVRKSLNFATENSDSTSTEVAVKMLYNHADESAQEDLLREISFMKRLGYHPHVLSMVGCITLGYEPLLVIEFCANGDLLSLLRRHRSDFLPDSPSPLKPDDVHLTIRDLLSFAWQVADGLIYFGSKNFIHRDVAARNVLITHDLVAKISDFGLCRHSEDALYTTKGGKLPIKWMALEALTQAEFSPASDVWSYGVFLYELLSCGDLPYPTVDPADMATHLKNGHRLEQPIMCDDELYSLMKKTWSSDPADRPTFQELRTSLTRILENMTESYGYLSVTAEYARLASVIGGFGFPTQHPAPDPSIVAILDELADPADTSIHL
uniref:Protein kinase domain-containing protein n=1 Tax=Panagrellus redivivus TaxID=6233 RepID=A0A7E4VQ30_PANRE